MAARVAPEKLASTSLPHFSTGHMGRTPMKTCTKCGECKPLTEFPRSVKGKDGYRERCRPCHNEDNRAYKQRNADKIAAARRRLYEETKDRVLMQSRAWYEANKQRKAETTKRWAQANRNARSHTARQYQLRRLKAVPPWADQSKIDALYAEAKALRDLGIDAEVDHIIPLRGRTVSGLHWHGNLKLILAEDNRRKSNKLLDVEPLACP